MKFHHSESPLRPEPKPKTAKEDKMVGEYRRLLGDIRDVIKSERQSIQAKKERILTMNNDLMRPNLNK
jgi:hypothetical protein